MKLTPPWMVVATLSAFSAASLPIVALAKPAVRAVKPEAVTGELIVRLRSEGKQAFSVAFAQAKIRQVLLHTFGEKSVASIQALAMDAEIQKVKLAAGADVDAAIAALQADPSVKYAEPNFIYRTQVNGPAKVYTDPSDIEFPRQWDLKNTGQTDKDGQVGRAGSDVNVAPVWERGVTGDRRVFVAVIDTGVDFNHPDLAANIYTNPREIAGNGIDDDANGIVDDVHGASFTGTVGNNASLDDNNHGTHCSGTIGAVGNDGFGLTGVNWQVSILPVKFLTASGSGSLDGAVNAIKYATKMHVTLMSNSWGGGGFSQALKDAIQEANDAGILFVAAAGNNRSDNDALASYPASYDVPNVVAVAATDNRDVLASFSNYGKRLVHVAAPGHNILSTLKGGLYGIYSGTSMACPHVAGAAALLWSRFPELTAAEVKARLIATSAPISGLKSKVLAQGRIDVTNLIDNVIPEPTGPRDDQWENANFTVESTHPYAVNANVTFPVSIPGVRYLRVVFEKIDTENAYDFVSVESASGEVVESVTGLRTNYTTEYVTGDTATIRLKADDSNQKWGFKVSGVQVVR